MAEELKHKLDELIRDGEAILQQQAESLNMFDVPWLYSGRLEQFNAQYKAWRKRFDEVIEECKNQGLSFGKIDSASGMKTTNIEQ